MGPKGKWLVNNTVDGTHGGGNMMNQDTCTYQILAFEHIPKGQIKAHFDF